jgi:hypothetical protein
MPVTSILFGQPVMVGEPPEPSFFSDLYRETFTGTREEVPALPGPGKCGVSKRRKGWRGWPGAGMS